MKILYGIILVLFGSWLFIRKIITFIRGEQGNLGYDAYGIMLGLTCAVCGVISIIKYI